MTTATAAVTECPRCGKKGKSVKPVTLRALLTDAYAVPERRNPQGHRRCWRVIGCRDEVIFRS